MAKELKAQYNEYLKSTAPDMDMLWSRIESEIDKKENKTDSEAGYKEKRKEIKVSKIRTGNIVAFAAALAVIISAAVFMKNLNSGIDKNEAAVKTPAVAETKAEQAAGDAADDNADADFDYAEEEEDGDAYEAYDGGETDNVLMGNATYSKDKNETLVMSGKDDDIKLPSSDQKTDNNTRGNDNAEPSNDLDKDELNNDLTTGLNKQDMMSGEYYYSLTDKIDTVTLTQDNESTDIGEAESKNAMLLILNSIYNEGKPNKELESELFPEGRDENSMHSEVFEITVRFDEEVDLKVGEADVSGNIISIRQKDGIYYFDVISQLNSDDEAVLKTPAIEIDKAAVDDILKLFGVE